MEGTPGYVSRDEDLYSVFLSRSQLMSWSPDLWRLEEAELSNEVDISRAGWVQVGLTNVAAALPALIQCVNDAIARFGELDVSAVQVTGLFLDRRHPRRLPRHVQARNWFNLSPLAQNPRAHVSVVTDQEEGALASRVQSDLNQANTGSFRFGPAVDPQIGHEAEIPDVAPRSIFATKYRSGALMVELPEWALSSIGWTLALTMDAVLCHSHASRHVAIRISRLP